MNDASSALLALRRLADPAKAQIYQRFFKTGEGEYGEGDRFLGVTVPAQRALAKGFHDLPLPELAELLASPWHEARLFALIVLVNRAKKADFEEHARLAAFYLKHADRIDNWDLVDTSAPGVLGDFIVRGGSDAFLEKLAASKSMWRRRIAVLTTFSPIRKKDFRRTLALCERFLGEEHDLMHKATGWMLREAGKRDQAVLRRFLAKHHRTMPRTMLRYAIEKMDAAERAKWMAR